MFAAGTLVAVISPGFAVLFAGRLIQAAGTGLLFPLLTNVVLAIVPFHKRGAAMGTFGIVITFAPAIGLFSTIMLVPIFLQNTLGYTPLLAGLAMLPGGVVMGIMSPITGRLFDRYGARWLAVTGLTLMAIT